MGSIVGNRPFVVPKPSLFRSFNPPMVLVVALAFAGFSAIFSLQLGQTTGPILFHPDYCEVEFKAMTNFDLDQMNGQITDVPAKFRALDGKKIELIGEMWDPKGATEDKLSYFQLVNSKTNSGLSGPPLAQHFIDGNVVPGNTCYYYPDGKVAVWGTLHIRFRRDTHGVINSVYAIDVVEVDPL